MMSHIQWPVEKQVLNTFRYACSSNRPESIDCDLKTFLTGDRPIFCTVFKILTRSGYPRPHPPQILANDEIIIHVLT